MCGIVGYIGGRDVISVLTEGLSKLEYRGYDSAGLAYMQGRELGVIKTKGRLQKLKEILDGKKAPDTIGIGHTRWATHGEPSDINSHPHTNCAGDIAIVHNGIIENYLKLKSWLEAEGEKFISDTDTEVIAHLVNHFYQGDLMESVIKSVDKLEGSFAIGVISANHPDEVIAVKKDSPLVIGLGKGENMIASDIPAILQYTRDIYLLDDKEIARLEKDGVTVFDAFGERVKKDVFHVDWDVSQAERSGYPHFMIKEIFEEPKALQDTLFEYVTDSGLDVNCAQFFGRDVKDIEKIVILACGTAYHAGVVGKYIIERIAKIPVEVDIASEFRYRHPLLKENYLAIVISQSGETADTIGAMREAKKAGCRVMAVANVVGSTVAREADGVLYTRAGPEIAVASTKAYSTQLMAVYMLCLVLAREKGTLTGEQYTAYLAELKAVPEKVASLIEQKAVLQRLAASEFMQKSVFFIGRGLDYALALEGSLKLKEISYIHSEAYAAGELKHGTIALIEEGTLVVAICTQKALLEKTISNIKEVKARGAKVLTIAFEGEVEIENYADEVIYIPKAEGLFAPILAVTSMQLFAYYMAVEKGCDVDKPRNLAKSVTVE